eukprot:6860376-Prymnesium_polylepis.1
MVDSSQAERDRVVASHRRQFSVRPEWVHRARTELRGRRLACWCVARPPRPWGRSDACHGDTLNEVANCNAGRLQEL